MPIIPIVVEGDTDQAFFNQVPLLRLSSKELSLEPRNAKGRGKLQKVVKGLLADGVTQLIVAEDLNGRTEEQVIQSHKDSISTSIGRHATDLSPSGDKFRVQDVVVAVVPMGLPGDRDLGDLGITSHSMEDYLIRLLLEDASLRPAVPRFRDLIRELIDTIRRYDVSFNSTKELFQLVKPIIKHGFSDTGVVEALFQNAKPDVLHSVMDPLLDRLEQAIAP